MFAVLLSDAKTFPYRERFASLKVFSSILWWCNLFTSSFIISDARSGLFDSPENGNYYVINAPKSGDLIKSMDENVQKYAYSDANPAYGSGTNSQNHAPMIKYKK